MEKIVKNAILDFFFAVGGFPCPAKHILFRLSNHVSDEMTKKFLQKKIKNGEVFKEFFQFEYLRNEKKVYSIIYVLLNGD